MSPASIDPGRPPGPRPDRRVGLRPTAALPGRAKLCLAAVALVVAGVTVWVIVRLFDSDGRALAIILSVLAVIGAGVITVAVITLTRMLYSLGAVPYLLGRGVRRLLGRR